LSAGATVRVRRRKHVVAISGRELQHDESGVQVRLEAKVAMGVLGKLAIRANVTRCPIIPDKVARRAFRCRPLRGVTSARQRDGSRLQVHSASALLASTSQGEPRR
jgi:hypothetical protein